MLFSLDSLKEMLYILPVALISLTIHEYCHGFVAYKLGDPTAKDQGRLSLNPIRHLDPLGFLLMLFCRVGYAKPVPVNPLYFKNPKKGMLLTAAAGPLSNAVLGFVSSFFAVLFMYFYNYYFFQSLIHETTFVQTNVFLVLYKLFIYMALINIGLAIFNLIPVHPFDGSRIMGYFMPNSYHRFVMEYGQYIYLGFFVLLLVTDFISEAIGTVQMYVFDLFEAVWSGPAEALVRLVV